MICFKAFNFLDSYFINGLIEFFDDVKPVENIECIRKFVGDDLKVWPPHIRAGYLNMLTPRSSHFLEKSIKGFGFSIFDNRNKSLALIVDLINESHIIVALGIGNFINANGFDAVQVPMLESVINDPFDRIADIVP